MDNYEPSALPEKGVVNPNKDWEKEAFNLSNALDDLTKDFEELNLWIAIRNYSEGTTPQGSLQYKDFYVVIPQRSDFHEFDVTTHSTEVGAIMARILDVNLPISDFNRPNVKKLFKKESISLNHLDNQKEGELSEIMKLRKKLFEETKRSSLFKDFSEDGKISLTLLAYFHDIEKYLEGTISPSIKEGETFRRAEVGELPPGSYTISQRSNKPLIKNFSNTSLYLEPLPEKFTKNPLYDPTDKSTLLTLQFLYSLTIRNILPEKIVDNMIEYHLSYTQYTRYIKKKSSELFDEGLSDKSKNAGLLLCICDELGKIGDGTKIFQDRTNQKKLEERYTTLINLI